MYDKISLIKGIHPGFFLEHELKKRKIPKGRFALKLQEFPQTLVSITKGKRRMNTALALKIENTLGLEEGFLMVLQTFYDVAELKKSQNTQTPDLSKLREVLFWDTDMKSFDWNRQKKAIIQRVFERGNESEKMEIIRFYGQEIIDAIISPNGK